MKNRDFKVILCLLTAVLFIFASCEKSEPAQGREDPKQEDPQKEDPKQEEPGEEESGQDFAVKEKVSFTDESGFVFSVNGRSIAGCSVEYNPDGKGKAAITVFGEAVDIYAKLAEILNTSKTGNGESVISHVIPGEEQISMTVSPVKGDGNKDNFQGEGSTGNCTYKFSGSVTASGLELVISDLKLNPSPIVGTEWKLVDPTDNWLDMIIFDWTYTTTPKTPISTLLPSVFTLLKGVVSPQEILAEYLTGLNLYEDGTITADFLTDDNVPGETPRGLIDYFNTGEDGRLMSYPNAGIGFRYLESYDIGTLPELGFDTANIANLIAGYMTETAKKGIPAGYSIVGDKLEIWFETETVTDLLSLTVKLFDVDGMTDAIVDYIINDVAKEAGLGYTARLGLKALLDEFFKVLPENIDKTKSVRIGARFVRK